MAHLSEDAVRLTLKKRAIQHIAELGGTGEEVPAVHLLRLPACRTDDDVANMTSVFETLAQWGQSLHEKSVVCVLANPCDAARLLPFLGPCLHFQLWIAVKTVAASATEAGILPHRHLALLVLTRSKAALQHTKTRIGYSYCPACGKTTKDYGGKKHTYHEYGTLMSDVWRDLEIEPNGDIEAIETRLADLFGYSLLDTLHSVDLRDCVELEPQPTKTVESFPDTTAFHAPEMQSRLIQDDCLSALREIPDNSIDFCFADPPYNLKKKYDTWNDAQEITEYFAWCDAWLGELCRVVKPGNTVAILNIPLWAVRHYKFLAARMNFQAWIAWDALGFPVRQIMPAHYAIICFTKGPARALPGLSAKEDGLTPQAEGFCLRASCVSNRRKNRISDTGTISDLWSDVHRLKHNSRRVDHPCQLPPLLMQRLFALFTKPGEIVLDCFNGAGTSTLVAEQMGRRFVGVELSPEYHQIAQERHCQIARGENPFDKSDSVPTAKNSAVRRVAKQNYAVSKKTLQLDVRRIARELGRLPTRDEVAQLSPFPMEYYETYFVSWGEVCAAARTTGMIETPRAIGTSPQIQMPL